MIITFATEPGIIPARLWGSDLPAKYKSIGVMKNGANIIRIKIKEYFIGTQ